MEKVDEIKRELKNIQSRRSKWLMSNRRKNIHSLFNLGINPEIALDEIYTNLSWKNYIAGPEIDDHYPPIPGAIWIFGLRILETPCYIKFQDRPNGVVFWISVHEAKYPLNFPYL